MKKLLDMDLMGRIRESFIGEEGSKFGIHREQDVEPILDYAAAKRELQEGGRWGDGRHVATIPNIIVERMMRDPRVFPDEPLAGILDTNYKVLDQKRWKAWLNDSENKLFRTFGGRI